MKRLSMVVVVVLSACASHGVMVSQEQVSALERGKTTEAEVIARLGQPTSVSTVNGQRTLIYSGAHAQARPASFIPFVGAFVGGTDVRASSVILRFDATGHLADVISTQTASGTGMGLAAGAPIAPVEAQPRKVE